MTGDHPYKNILQGSRKAARSDDPDLQALGMRMLEWFDAGAEPGRLEAKLGLARQGGTPTRKQMDIDARNAALLRLWREMPAWRGEKASVAARQMVDDFDRYEKGRWKRDQRLGMPEKQPDVTWWILRTHDIGMLGDPKQLQRILEGRGNSIPPLNVRRREPGW